MENPPNTGLCQKLILLFLLAGTVSEPHAVEHKLPYLILKKPKGLKLGTKLKWYIRKGRQKEIHKKGKFILIIFLPCQCYLKYQILGIF